MLNTNYHLRMTYKPWNHLKIQATLDHILAEGYKLDSIYGDVRNF